MKTLFLILLLIPLFGLSQEAVRTSDPFYSGEKMFVNGAAGITPSNRFHVYSNFLNYWEQYLDDCNELVPDTIKQSGVVNVKYKPVIVNGEISHYILSPIDTVWNKVECKEYKLDDYEELTIRSGNWGGITDNMIYTTNVNAITYTPVNQVNNKINITRNKICHIKKQKASWNDFWNRWLVKKKIIELN